MKKFIQIVCLMMFPILGQTQTTDISGIINSYVSVSDISGNDITVSSSSEFSVGDLVIIMQMQGATLNETNTASFGSVTDLNSAGNYEYGTICSIPDPNTISLVNVQRSYEPSGTVQLIRVPVYTNATVTAILTAAPWNGSTGGVLAFQCTETLTMNEDINLNGLGFRGGEVTTSTYSCAWFSSPSDYFYNITSGEGAKKGEGIGHYIIDKTGGRGAQTNGGGGGNDHNSGGGGGANAGAGGNGGERIAASTFTCSGVSPGIGGKFNTFSNALNKVFMGGGGGAGHENNPGTATKGANGGGIVMIKSNTLVGNSQIITAQGESIVTLNSEDGAGGGGAGGTVLLDIESYSETINVNVSGSNGGNVGNTGPSNCNGPGGGGGGGILWINQSLLPINIILNNNGGASGTTLTSSQPGCTIGGSNNAQNGNPGVLLTDLVPSESFCSIPINAQEASICSSDSLFIAGEWQNNAGVYYDTLFTACCDSIIETTLTVLESSTGTDLQSSCDSIVWIDGMTYTASNSSATHLLTNSVGCDSIVTLDLTISEVDISITNDDPSISSNATDATYRWLNCDNDFAVIPDETSATFIAEENGNYAVEVTQNGCVDTSLCSAVKTIGITENDPFRQITFYPNPGNGKINLDLGELKGISITVSNVIGQPVFYKKEIDQSIQIDLNQPVGIYFMTLMYGDIEKTYKLIIK